MYTHNHPGADRMWKLRKKKLTRMGNMFEKTINIYIYLIIYIYIYICMYIYILFQDLPNYPRPPHAMRRGTNGSDGQPYTVRGLWGDENGQVAEDDHHNLHQSWLSKCSGQIMFLFHEKDGKSMENPWKKHGHVPFFWDRYKSFL